MLAETGHLLPVDGECPKCETYLIWGDLIRFQKDNFKFTDGLDASAGVVTNETDDDSEEFVEKDDDDDDEDNTDNDQCFEDD